MPRHPAKVLEDADVRRLLTHVDPHRHRLRNRVLVLLSFKAGLRACEMAGLDWSMVLDSRYRVGPSLLITRQIAKGDHARRVPVHPQLARALSELHRDQGFPRDGPVARSERGTHLTPRSIVNWFSQIYAELSLQGCSSHSGRRTFITRAARVLARTGGSLRDIQELAGHQAITTTERYIEGDRDAQRRLIALI